MMANAEMCTKGPVHLDNSNSSSRLKDMGCGEEKLKMGKENPMEKASGLGEDPRTSKENSQEQDRAPP